MKSQIPFMHAELIGMFDRLEEDQQDMDAEIRVLEMRLTLLEQEMKYTPVCPLDQELFQGELGLPSHQNHDQREVAKELELGGKVRVCRSKREVFRVLPLPEECLNDTLKPQHASPSPSQSRRDLQLSDLRPPRNSATRPRITGQIVSQTPSPYKRSAAVRMPFSPTTISASSLRYYSNSNAAGKMRISSSPTRSVKRSDFKRVDGGDCNFLRELFEYQ